MAIENQNFPAVKQIFSQCHAEKAILFRPTGSAAPNFEEQAK
ncbi:MAG: hypothetical protein PUB32_02920 [Clostridiales bacterium]|nr:hypothetical protein [Clostridiales bacterium]